MSFILCLIGTVFTIYGLILCAKSNFNLGVIAVVGLGLFILLWGVFYDKIKKITSKGVMRCIKYIVIILFCCEVLLLGFLAVYGINDNVTYNEEAVIVLGAGIRGDRVSLPLKLRLDTAIEYSNKNPEALIVVTGGQGYQETVTEAYAMEKYLVEHGVDKSRIIKEEKATSTNENMRYSKLLLDGIFDGDYEIAVVTNNFHIYRSAAIAHMEGFEAVTHVHAGLQWYNLLPCYLRESLAVLKLWVFD